MTSRNETTVYDFSHQLSYGASNLAAGSELLPESNLITIEMIIKVPKDQQVLYVPGLMMVLKLAWVQYFCAFVFWYYLLYKGFFNFLVQRRVFEVVEQTDLNMKNMRRN